MRGDYIRKINAGAHYLKLKNNNLERLKTKNIKFEKSNVQINFILPETSYKYKKLRPCVPRALRDTLISSEVEQLLF